MAAGIFTMLVILALMAAVMGLTVLAGMEKRRTGSARWTSKLFIAVIAGAFWLFYLDDAMVSRRDAETVRMLFHLPDDIAIGRIYGSTRRPVCHDSAVSYRTTVELTRDQFARYVASVHDRSVWRAIIPPHYLPHKSSLQFAGDALAWKELPEPGWIGQQQLVWNIAGVGVRRGLAQCYTFNRAERPAQAPSEAANSMFSVTSCNARARAKTPVGGGHVAAALDFDKRSLAIAINFDSKPDYCNNRLSKWLGGVLGLDSN